MGGRPYNLSMGFFFAKKPVKSKGKSKHQRNLASLSRIGCAACPLNHASVKSPKMAPTLVPDCDIFFLGEAPGKHEDETSGKPLTGPSGTLLHHVIDRYGLKYSFDNTIRDRPPSNRDPDFKEIECCRGLVTKAIEEAKPKVIVGLGRFALWWALNTEDQFGLRGRVFAVKIGTHKCWFIPTYHPARVIHSANEQAKKQKKNQGKSWIKLENTYLLTTYYGRTFKLDIEKAIAQVNEPPPEIEDENELRSKVTVTHDFNTLISYLGATKRAPCKAVDIETNAIRPYGRGAAIISVGFSFNSTSFSFPLDHRLHKWSSVERKRILDLIKDILIDDTIKIAHNAPFEIEWFIHYFGKEVVNHAAWECTQLQAHFLDERRGAGQSNDDTSRRATYQSLDFLIRQHFGISFKHLFDVQRKDIANANLNEMLVYNATDHRLTLKLWHRQNKLLHASGLYSAFQHAIPRQSTVALTQHFGMPVNQNTVKKLQKKLGDEIAVIEAEIEELPVVREFIKNKSGKVPGKFNPMGDDAITIFRDYLKRTEIQVQDGTKLKWSVDKHILDKIDHPLSKLIVKLRNKSKMKSTYVDGLELGPGELVYSDGHIHCNFNSTFTTTGRFSSDFPNMQNFPNRNDSWIREQIEAYDGYIIVAADYGQLEMCGAAMCSQDRNLVKALWDDYDTHMDWATRLADIHPDCVGGDFGDHKIKKAFRSLVKNKLVFPALYGALNKSIAGYLNIDVAYIDKLMDDKGGFWDTFAGVKEWQDLLLRNYRKNGYVESPTGRRRNHPLTANEAINAPIQCLASEIVVEAMCKLSYMASEGKWYLHPRLNIHDDLTMIVPEEKLVSSIQAIYKTMLTPSIMELIPEKARVPLSVSVSVGKNWYEMEEVGKFWSHRDC